MLVERDIHKGKRMSDWNRRTTEKKNDMNSQGFALQFSIALNRIILGIRQIVAVQDATFQGLS